MPAKRDTTRRLEYVPLDDLVPSEKNPKNHNEQVIADGIAKFGLLDLPVIDERTGRLVAGHGRRTDLLARRERGQQPPDGITVDVEGRWLVPTVRGWRSRSDHEAHAAGVTLNQATIAGGFNDVDLAALVTELAGVDAELVSILGFDDDQLAALLADPVLAGGANELLTDPDAVVADAPALTQPSDLWVLGEHRLACGDSATASPFDALLQGEAVGCILTDPPYGISLETDYAPVKGSVAGQAFWGSSSAGRTYRPVIGDDRPFDASFLRSMFVAVAEQFWFGADYYRRTLSEDDMDGSWLVWDKRTEATDVVIGSGFELIWSAKGHKRDLLRFYWCGAPGAAENRNRMHPTQKPAALLSDILDRWAPASCVVLDPFAGSGSTLIAAHQTGRRARLVEIDPHYCDVICKRFQLATNVVPTRDGEPHDFLAETESVDAG